MNGVQIDLINICIDNVLEQVSNLDEIDEKLELKLSNGSQKEQVWILERTQKD